MSAAGPERPGPPTSAAAWTPSPVAPGAPRRKLTWLWALVPLLVVIVAGTVLAVVLGIGRIVEPIEATNDYLAALRDGRYEDAYALLCEARQQEQTEATFVRLVEREQQRTPVTGYDFTTSSITNGTATTEGTLEIDGVEYDARARLRREDGDWKVCRVTYNG